MSEQMNDVQVASVTTDLLGLKTFSCTISTVFMVDSTLPNVLIKIRSLGKTDNFVVLCFVEFIYRR